MRRWLHHGIKLVGGASAAIAGPAVAQENRLALTAQVLATYDTNVLRINREPFNPRDNLAITPRIGVDLSRRLARQRVFLTGAVGYNFNSRFKFLDREDISLTGGANLRFGPRCQIDPSAIIFRAQSDLEDLGEIVANTVTTQDYTLSISCPRPAGFFPAISAGVLRVDNSEVRRERNQTVVEGRAALVYRRPSLGQAELYGQVIDISRARRLPSQTGALQDKTQVKTVGLQLSRSVGTRVSARASVGYTDVDPLVPSVPDFSGVTYDAQVTYALQPGFTVSASTGRSVSARGNLGSSYALSRFAGLSTQVRLTARTNVGADAEIRRRSLRGEDLNPVNGLRGNSRQAIVSLNGSYAIARPLQVTLTTRYRTRNSDNDRFDYESYAAILGLTLRL